MRRLLALVGFGFLLSGCSLLQALNPLEPTTEPPVPTAAASPTGEPPATGTINLAGHGNGTSDTFALDGGQYVFRYGATADSPADCTSVLTLKTSDSDYSLVISDGHRNGARVRQDVPAGDSYFVEATSTCDWLLTIEPLA
jgi:hypothetical protein